MESCTDELQLHSAKAIAPGDVWSVGEAPPEALAIHYTDPCQVSPMSAR